MPLYALNYLEGQRISPIAEQHRPQECLSFLGKIDQGTPKEVSIHLIADNYATHKHAQVKAWLDRHPRFHRHFTPTSSSWLNRVERFFRDVTEHLREGSFASVRELADTIITFLAERNPNPKRYVWKAKGRISCAKSNGCAELRHNNPHLLHCKGICETLH